MFVIGASNMSYNSHCFLRHLGDMRVKGSFVETATTDFESSYSDVRG